MVRTAWSQIRQHPSRIVAVVLAIVLGVGFTAANLVFTATFTAHLERTVSAESTQADVVVLPGDNGEDPAVALAQIRAVPGVAVAEPLRHSSAGYSTPKSRGSLELATVPTDPRLRWYALEQGQWPAAADQILLDRPTATSANLPVGTRVTFVRPVRFPGCHRHGGRHRRHLRVGLVGVHRAGVRSTGAVHRPESAGSEPGFGAGRRDRRRRVGRPADHCPARADRSDRAEQASVEISALGADTQVLTIVLLAFAVVALIVAVIVIANTFTIGIIQRRRQLALLRCVGADSRQVRTQLLAEATLIGVIGSALGVAAGIGVGLIAAGVTGLDAGGPAMDPVRLLGVFGLGVIVTVLAVYLPATRAMRIPPLAALRPVDEPAVERRSGRIRALVGGGLTVAGLALLGLGVTQSQLLAALAGGAVSAFGILVLARIFIPPLLRLVGGLGRAAGVPGRLAAANSVRNPARAAATSAALMVGVGLIVTLQVAAASASATLDKSIADRYPVDVAIVSAQPVNTDGSAGRIDPAQIARVAAVPGLVRTVGVPGTTATAADLGPYGPRSADQGGFWVIGLSTDAREVVRGGTSGLSDDVIQVPGWWLGEGGLTLGQPLVVTVGGRQLTFTVAAGRLSDSGPLSGSAVITEAALSALDPSALTAAPVAIWSQIAPDTDLPTVRSALNELVAPLRNLQLMGVAAERAATDQALSTIITLATGMLAVAVIIAIVGIGNTLGLSVIERTRESGLLRALGLRRGRLRSMLAIEALLLALVGSIVGVVVGIGYGWAGAEAAIGATTRTVVFDIPWATIGLVLLLAVVAGLAASVLPARRAAMTAPVAALAED